jgi:hypothetical protein
MFDAAKFLAPLAELLASVSTNLSIALVLGLAVLTAVPHDYAPRARASAAAGPAPVEVVSIKPVTMLPAEPSGPLPAEVPIAPAPPSGPEADSDLAPGDAAEPMVVAARRRSRAREEPAQQKAEPVRKNSAIAAEDQPARQNSSIAAEQKPEEKPKSAAPIPPPDAKPDTAQAEPPKPDVWSEEEVIAALRECLRLLAPIAADVEVAQPLKHEQCGAPAPVALKRIGSGAGKVEINPPATLNCAMVVSLHSWVEKTLQPAAQENLGSPIARLRNASGYACRARNGSPLNSDKLSEHAKANAIDIAGFVTADGRTVEVARFWGPTARDLREAERIAAERARQAKEAKDAKEAAKKEKDAPKPEPAKTDLGPTRTPSAIAARPEDLKSVRRDAPIAPAEREKAGTDDRDRKGEPKNPVAALAAERERAARSDEGLFLRRLHKGACGTFGTVLGPEANEAHRDHFHFDLAQRRRNAFCE